MKSKPFIFTMFSSVDIGGLKFQTFACFASLDCDATTNSDLDTGVPNKSSPAHMLKMQSVIFLH